MTDLSLNKCTLLLFEYQIEIKKDYIPPTYVSHYP